MGVSGDSEGGHGQLPYVDEHAVEVAAGTDATWEALLTVAERSFAGGGASRFARLLGCRETRASGPRPLAAGSTIPGFRVAVATPERELALVGRHRFSDYALVFRLERLPAGASGVARTRIVAETRAAFPGAKGQAYKTLVIRSRGHVLVTRRMLRAVGGRAERDSHAGRNASA